VVVNDLSLIVRHQEVRKKPTATFSEENGKRKCVQDTIEDAVEVMQTFFECVEIFF